MKTHNIVVKIAIVCTSLHLIISCSTMKYSINQNNKSTETQLNYFLQKNGNVFYISSTYATFSTIWTYNRGEIEIYKLVKGKINKKETILEKDFLQYSELTLQDVEKELYQKCALELDGDNFGFRIDINGKTYKYDYAIDINCLNKELYKSEFLNKIVNDIKTYKIWEIKHQ